MSPNKSKFRPQRTRLGTALIAAATLSLLAGPVVASQLIYTPVNPSFGGNPLNGPYLLQKAQAEKSFSLPMDDLSLSSFDGILGQTNAGTIIKKGANYYLLENDGTLALIDFENAKALSQVPLE